MSLGDFTGRDAIRKMTRRIFAIVRRGVLDSFTDSKNPRVSARGSHGITPVEMLQNYGDAYWPPEGAELVYFSSQGDEDLAYAVGATGGPDKPALEYPGHRILWSVFGHRIEMKDDGSMDIEARGPIRINAPEIILNGINWDGHRHTGVDTGGGTSGGPV